MTAVVATAVVLDPLMDPAEADAMVRLCEAFPGYGLYVTERSDGDFAPELAQRYDAAANYVRTGGRFGRREPAADAGPAHELPARELRLRRARSWPRASSGFLHHEALLDAARSLYGRPVIEPAIAYANILLPGQELAVHTDVPEFRGANRTLFPQWLMVVMHHSGPLRPWRMPIATGIAYFADESAGLPAGGELAYWPDGVDGAVAVLPTRHNTGIVLDTDSVFHGVDRVGAPDDGTRGPVAPGNVLAHDGGRWVLRPERGSDEALAVVRVGRDPVLGVVEGLLLRRRGRAGRVAHPRRRSLARPDPGPARGRSAPAGRAHRRRADRARAGPAADRHLRALPRAPASP